MEKAITILKYLCVISIMIMGFNQAIITAAFQFPYELLDAMTIGSGLFFLLIGIVNLFAITFCEKHLLTLSHVANFLGALFAVYINTALSGISSYAAIIPFLLLLLINFRSARKLNHKLA